MLVLMMIEVRRRADVNLQVRHCCVSVVQVQTELLGLAIIGRKLEKWGKG